MRRASFGVVAGVLLVSQGCLLAAAAGGAAAGVHLTSRGAEAVVERPVGSVEAAVRRVFRDWDIELTDASVEGGGAKRKLEGEVDDLEVTVSLESEGQGTKIDVSARRDVASWDKEYAERLLARIIAVAG